MKKYLFPALALGLVMTSCQSDEPFVDGLGGEQQVSFTVSLPDVASTRAGGEDSSKGGVSNNIGADVTFNVALYLDGKLVYADNQKVASIGNHTSATFEPTLVIGENYKLVAFAEFDDDATAAGKGVTPETNMGLIAMEQGINNEKNDEYFVSTTVTAAPKLSAELKRPYGKLRLIAEDLHEAERQFGAAIETVEVTYEYTRPTHFNVLEGTFGSAYTQAEQTFSAAYGEYKADTDASRTIFVDYIPGKKDGTDTMMPFTVTVKFENGKTYTRIFTQDIPVRRNWLTTLKGHLFTMNSELTLTIEENFDGEMTENFDENIEWIFANGGTITLQKDVMLKKSLIVADDANVLLNLNGHKIVTDTTSNDIEIGDAIIVYGNLTIEGEGTVQGNTRAVWARGDYDAKVRINGGHYIGATTEDAKCEVIYASGNGVIDIYGGEFEAVNQAEGFAESQYAVLNLYGNGKTGCDINVYGGKFKNFNPSNNISENPKKNFVEKGYTSVLYNGYYNVVSNVINFTEESYTFDFIEVAENDAVFNMNNANVTSGSAVNYGMIVRGNSNVAINDANINSLGGGVGVVNGASVEFNSGKMAVNSSSTSGRYLFYLVGAGSVVTINGGEFSWSKTLNQKRAYIYADAGTTAYVTGGTFGPASSRSGYTEGILGEGTVVITGGTFGFNPSKWVAEGYEAVKNGSVWTVSKK